YDLGMWLADQGTPPSTGGSVTSETEPNNSAATATDVSTSWRAVQYQSTTSGSISSGDADFYAYQFTAGDLVTINIYSTSALAARVNLLNASGVSLAAEDGSSVLPSSNTGDSPLYAYVIPTTGIYYVEVRAALGTGTYTANVYLSTTTPPPAPDPSASFDY